ncbi:MAG: hypothetical protein MUC67_10775 [Acidobacteria bacterium]|jgi:hypothetical protein|nr:hypothetical protein [Acidobacteriota bacterium]
MPAIVSSGPLPLERTVTAGEALARFATERLEASDQQEGCGVTAALELIVQFVDQMGPELLDPMTRRRLERGRPRAARDLLDAGGLARLIGPCARVLPYSVLAGHGVLSAFAAEAPRLVRWLAAQGLAAEPDLALFRAHFHRARPALARHERLQAAVELASSPFVLADTDEVSVGHYLVEEVRGRALAVSANDQRLEPVRCPAGFEGVFCAGQSVSLALLRGAIGFVPLAMNLPATRQEFDVLLGKLRLKPSRPS